MLKLNSIDKRFISIVVADNVNVQLENCTTACWAETEAAKPLCCGA